MSSSILLPEDPDFGKEIVWGDAYSKTPKAINQHNAEEHDTNSSFKYAASITAHAPDAWVKAAQQAGVSNIMTDPMWFSPLHTPQNWQIASKRREVYQWSFISSKNPCYLSKYGDFSLDDIKDMYTKWQNDFVSRKQLYIQNNNGEKAKPDICTKRYVEKKANRLKILGLPHVLEITHDHKCIIIKKEHIKCSKNKYSSKNCISGVCSPICVKSKCDKHEYIDYKISTVNAEDIRKGDYILSPFPTEIKDSIITTKEQARFAGHLASDGSISDKYHSTRICMNVDEIDEVFPVVQSVFEENGIIATLSKCKSSRVQECRTSKESFFREFSSNIVKGSGKNKRFTEEVLLLNSELQKHVLGAYIQSDGTFNKVTEQIEITTISKHLANQLQIMCYRCGIMSNCSKQPRRIRNSFPTKNLEYYIINIPKTFVHILQDYVPGKIPNHIYKPQKSIYSSQEKNNSDTSKFVKNNKIIRRINNRFFWKNYVVSPVVANVSFDYKGDVYDIRVPPTYAITANGISIHQCRFWYENEPKVAAAIDFYARFPMNGFILECPNRKVLSFFEHHVVKKLGLNERFKEISSEYFMIGDVFIHTDIECSHCSGSAIDPDTGEECNHPDGMFRRIFIMNPDWIEVQKSPLTDEPLIVLIPDEELQQIVHKRQPKAIYDRIPEKLKPLIIARAPIPISNRTISHLRHMPVPYGTYGTSIIRRLFTTLAYKTKIMTANWIVAERLILPVRVVKIGSDNRPASSTDIQDIQQQLASTANDPNLTIVTHHNFEYDWYGCLSSEENNSHVMTIRGRMHHKDLTNNDLIATWNVQTGKIEYQNYIRNIEFEYNSNNSSGCVYKIGNHHWTGTFTPNHRHYLSNGQIKRSDELKVGDEIVNASQWDWKGKIPQNLPHYTYPGNEEFRDGFKSLSLEQFCRFAGYFVTEGHIKHEKSENLRKESEGQAFVISQNIDSDCYSDIHELMFKISSKCYVTKDERRSIPNHQFNITNALLSRTLEKEFGSESENKHLPCWMLQLPKKYLRILLDSLVKGDGDSRRNRFSTVSSKLRDQFMEILMKLGFSPYFIREKVDREKQNDIFRILWSSCIKPRKFKINSIETVPYEGKMWCLEMPNKNFFIEIGGHILLTGNTQGKILQVTQEMEHIDKELLDGLMLNQALLNGEAAGYNCYDEDTEVLTDDGFKHYSEVDIEKDKIICYDVYTKTLKCMYATEKQTYDYCGEMIHFHGKRLDIAVTPNHGMLSSWDLKNWSKRRADKIKNGMRFLGASEFDNSTIEIEYPVIDLHGKLCVEIGEHVIELDVFLIFAGYYLSEGSSYSQKSNYHLHIYQSKKKEKVYSDIVSSLNKLGYNYNNYCYRENNSDQFTINSKELVLFMREHFGHGSHNKSIPSWIKNVPSNYLTNLLSSLVNGDGSHRNTQISSYSYSSVSEKLVDDIQEIAIRCGFSSRKWLGKKDGKSYGKSQRYWLHWSKGKNSNGSNPVVRKNNLKKFDYKGKVWCLTTPTGFFVTRRNGKIAIQGNSAQVGVETLIRRIESWRHTLKEWAEERIFKPIAEMQGFIDEKKSEEVGEKVFLYPRIKWNDLELKDKTQYHQMLMQLHDKQTISTQTLLDEIGLDYDIEVKRMRFEQAQMGPAGAMLGQGPGGGMGGMMGGATGGMPGGAASPMQSGGIGGDTGGMGGMEMGNGMSGGVSGGGGAASTAIVGGGKVTKKGKKNQQDEVPIPMIPIKLTKIEQKMASMLEEVAQTMQFNANNIRIQFPVENPSGGKAFSMDFAIPALKLDIECFHPDQAIPTNNGSKRIADVNIKDKLIGRNGDSVNIIRIIKKFHDGELLNIKAFGMLPLKITKNHPLLISRPKQIRIKREEPSISRTREYTIPDIPKRVLSDNVQKGDFLLIPKIKQNKTLESLQLSEFNGISHRANNLPNNISLCNDLGWLLGIYAAEGSSDPDKRGSVEFSFHIKETDIIAKTQHILKKLFNLNSSISNCRNCSKVIVCSTAFSRMVYSLFNKIAPNKRLPSFIFDCSYEFKKSYIQGFMEGDGCFRNYDSAIRLVSSSKFMMLDIQRLCMSMGHFASICNSRPRGTECSIEGRSCIAQGLWEVVVNFTGHVKSTYREDDNFFYVPIRKIESEKYIGAVHTFTTDGIKESNHTYCASNMIVFNCDGEVWHSSQEQVQDDQERDNLLAQRGWTILRFSDKTIEDAPQAVKGTINSYIQKAIHSPQKNASVQNGNSTIHYFKYGERQLKECNAMAYYDYLNEQNKSAQKIYKSEIFGNRSKEEYFANARKV